MGSDGAVKLCTVFLQMKKKPYGWRGKLYTVCVCVLALLYNHCGRGRCRESEGYKKVLQRFGSKCYFPIIFPLGNSIT